VLLSFIRDLVLIYCLATEYFRFKVHSLIKHYTHKYKLLNNVNGDYTEQC